VGLRAIDALICVAGLLVAALLLTAAAISGSAP
jgi:hypothetical protein